MKNPSEKTVILSAVRTPIGKYGGAFKDTSAVTLGASASVEAMKRAGVKPDQIDEVIFGMARQAGNRPNPARQILYRSGIPVERTAFSVNKACASWMKAITLAAQSLLLGENKIVLTGGTENMSQIPYLLDGARWGYRLGDGVLVDAMYRDGLFCPLAEMIMGETAEILAERFGISRREQDEYALQSQMKEKRAAEKGWFKDEIVPVSVTGKGGQECLVEADEHPRPETTLETLAKLPPVFKKGGSVTAGNSSGLTDAAAALILTTRSAAQKLGAKPLAEVLGFASGAVDPKEMGLGPVPATRKVLRSLNLELSDFDLIEINEAFAAQVLACERELRWDPARRNIKGGAIALGHPIGCTGARITVALLHSLIQEDKELGLATLCVSGGQGMALVLKRL
ncbi:MAG: acetyl-CoA acetyltransferase [Candidatus Aminicenantes bacterium RBG_13_59_9]|nr:MAG: acetyl-CoA acetyltransferase [Candidatus Aminicenantes bacterium RBG_13_59_9]